MKALTREPVMTPCDVTRRGFLRGVAALALARGAMLRAAAQTAGDGLLALELLGDGVWLHTSWQIYDTGRAPSNGLVIIGDGEGLLIDTACTAEDSVLLLDRLDEIAPGIRFRLLVTHAHDDRMAGIALMRERGVASLAHVKTARLAAAEELGAIDEVWWEADFHLTVGGRKIALFYPGPAHAADNVVAYLEDSGLLFGGCMLREATAVDLAGVEVEDLCRWPAAIAAVAARFPEIRIAVPGHGRPGDARLLDHTARLAEAAAALRCGDATPAAL